VKQKQFRMALACALLFAVLAGCQKKQDATQAPPAPETPPPPPQTAVSAPKDILADTNSPLYGWEKYSSAEGKFSAIFPSRPKEDDKTRQGADGEVQAHIFSSSKDPQNSYAVGYYDLPRLNEPKMMLARVEQSIVTGESAKIVSYKAMQAGGHYATQFEIVPGNHPNLSAKVRLIAVGQRVYMLMATYFAAQPNPDETDAFFNSFTMQN
jgi:hypothetical protein